MQRFTSGFQQQNKVVFYVAFSVKEIDQLCIFLDLCSKKNKKVLDKIQKM